MTETAAADIPSTELGIMSKAMDERPVESRPDYVTYVVVVHGIGEQRKNECVINVVNRFAEARRPPRAKDNRDVVTLGQASGQTGPSKVPVTEQPWVEFDGIPASPDTPPDQPFLGEPPRNPGENLRFVDLCWSDVMQDSVEHVGQDVDLWAKGLLGRLLRKHEAAETAAERARTQKETQATENTAERAKFQKKIQAAEDAKVPLWIRRVLYLLADTLLLVRFAMNFRFKEMKELVFVKFLGDVQLYGEYSRCRGRAVHRFHELMARVEAAHYARERKRSGRPRDPRYVIIAHSLGSIMSLDALLYASATSNVRRGLDGAWKFPGYLRDDDKKNEPTHEGRFALLDTGWVQRVRSFVTLGSPIDKYLTIWWMNYLYLLKCKGRFESREAPKIAHFNYCDELDPVGHRLDVVRETPTYKAVFKDEEDVVFNRYAIPGAAHNKYWTDQPLFRRILDRAVDDVQECDAARPRWFRRPAYWGLLFWLYSLVPLLVVLGTYASLSFAFQANGWRTAALAAAVFAFLVFFGRRLIDLSIWWRQIQRHKYKRFWGAGLCTKEEQERRRQAATAFRGAVVVVPTVWTAQSTATFQGLSRGLADTMPDWSSLSSVLAAGWPVRLAEVGAVVAVTIVAVALLVRRRLPAAYRTAAVDDGRLKAEAMLLVAGWLLIGVMLALHAPQHLFPTLALPAIWVNQLALFAAVATTVYAYRSYRFFLVKHVLRQSPQAITYSKYARPVPAQETPDGSSDQSQTSQIG